MMWKHMIEGIQLIFIIIYNVLDYVYLCAGFHCEMSMWHAGFNTAQFSRFHFKSETKMNQMRV